MTAGHQRERQAELRGVFSQLMGAEEATEPATTEPASDQGAAEPAPRRRRATGQRGSTGTRTARKASGKRASGPAVAPMPVAQTSTDTGRPQRLMVPLSVDEDRALKRYRLDDGIPAAARVRAMLQLYREDDRYRRAVDRTAQRMR